VVTYISVTEHLDSFTKGIWDTRDLFFYISFSAFFIFLTLRYLDSQKIRG
jgi:ABC-2 type transport system permease protein